MLNAGYEPLQIVSWQKAIILWFQQKVDVLEFHQSEVRSASESFQLPSVLRLRRYIRPFQKNYVRLSRQNVFIRDNFQCQYCRIELPPKQLTIDHILPVSRGGKTTWQNITTACSDCNHRKGNRTPEEARMPLLNKAYRPNWLPARQSKYKKLNYPLSWLEYLNIS